MTLNIDHVPDLTYFQFSCHFILPFTFHCLSVKVITTSKTKLQKEPSTCPLNKKTWDQDKITSFLSMWLAIVSPHQKKKPKNDLSKEQLFPWHHYNYIHFWYSQQCILFWRAMIRILIKLWEIYWPSIQSCDLMNKERRQLDICKKNILYRRKPIHNKKENRSKLLKTFSISG